MRQVSPSFSIESTKNADRGRGCEINVEEDFQEFGQNGSRPEINSLAPTRTLPHSLSDTFPLSLSSHHTHFSSLVLTNFEVVVVVTNMDDEVKVNDLFH